LQKSKKPQRIVVDTNLWISFLIGRRLGALLELFRNIEYDFVSTQIMRDEIHNVALRPKFRKYFSEDAVKALDNWLVLHTLNFDLDDIPQRCRDPKDDYLLELAIKSKAIYLVSGDDDLLDIGEIEGCRIMTFSRFLQEVGLF
jgi:putative PIN family toxin of toxin-antitoxin system